MLPKSTRYELKLLSLFVVITISFYANAQLPNWDYIKWGLNNNYNVTDFGSTAKLGLPEKIGSGISTVVFNNSYEAISTATQWPSLVDTNTNNTYLEFACTGSPDLNFPGEDCDFSPIAVQFNGYVNAVADSATFSVYIVDTASFPNSYDHNLYNNFYYSGNVTIKSTDPFAPTNVLAYFPYTSTTAVDTIPSLHSIFYSRYLMVRLYPISGNTIHINNVAISGYSVCLLPVKLKSFIAQVQKSNILLNWQTATETNTSHFNIQRSTTGKDFTTIGKVTAKGASEYSYQDALTTDDSRFTKLYYRLEIVDKDGSKTYSEIRELSITPNPAKDNVTISGTNLKQVKLLDNLGRVVAVKEAANSNSISIPVSYIAKGIYLVQATFKDGSVKTEKVVVE